MTIQEHMHRRFREAGMTIAGACALLAQIQHESAFRANNAEDSKGVDDQVYTARVDNGQITKQQFMHDSIGYGYAQWTYYFRKGLMWDYFKARKKSISDSETQIDFLIWEMKAYFQNQWKLVTTSNNLKDCTWELLDKWENPAEKTNNMNRRFLSAQKFYEQFKDLTIGEVRKMTVQDAINKALNCARAEIGYHEKSSNASLDDKTANSGSGNWTKYARELDALGNFYNGGKNGYAWCDVFYDWVLVKCFGADVGRRMIFQPLRSAGAGCLYSAQYYKQNGAWHTSNPQPGDQIFFSYAPGEYSHTGMVESIQNGIVTTIEGNTSDMVARRTYPISSGNIIGYGRPNWNLATGIDSGTDLDDDPVDVSSPAPTDRILKRDMFGDDVRELQEKLLKLGYDIGPDGADGDFGGNTYKAVVAFQTEHGLSPIDGEVGPDTRAAMEKAFSEASSPIQPDQSSVIVGPVNPSVIIEAEQPVSVSGIKVPHEKMQIRDLKLGMEGYDVKLAQAALQCWGYYIVVTGIFGKEMDEKIRYFQQAKGLEADGEIGIKTWKELLKV